MLRQSGFHELTEIFSLCAQVLPGEPVYAQVNRERKRTTRGAQDQMLAPQQAGLGYHDYSEHADHWQVANHLEQHTGANGRPQQQQQQQPGSAEAAAGDSWV
jgi:hypothetical protein